MDDIVEGKKVELYRKVKKCCPCQSLAFLEGVMHVFGSLDIVFDVVSAITLLRNSHEIIRNCGIASLFFLSLHIFCNCIWITFFVIRDEQTENQEWLCRGLGSGSYFIRFLIFLTKPVQSLIGYICGLEEAPEEGPEEGPEEQEKQNCCKMFCLCLKALLTCLLPCLLIIVSFAILLVAFVPLVFFFLFYQALLSRSHWLEDNNQDPKYASLLFPIWALSAVGK
jgi:hypothetical protein